MTEFKDGPDALNALQQASNGIDDAYWNNQDDLMTQNIQQAEAALRYLKGHD